MTIEMDYSSLVRNLDNMNYESEIYICKDNQILLSNNGYNQPGWPFSEWKENIQPVIRKNTVLMENIYRLQSVKEVVGYGHRYGIICR